MGGYLHALLVQEGVAFNDAPSLIPPVVINNQSTDPNLAGLLDVRGIGEGDADGFGTPSLVYFSVNDAGTFNIILRNSNAPALTSGFLAIDDAGRTFVGGQNNTNFDSLTVDPVNDQFTMRTQGGGFITIDPTNGFKISTTKLGFYSGAGAAKQTVSGAKLPSDVVLASLLAALVAYGLITDTST